MTVLKQLGERGVVVEWALSKSNVTRRIDPVDDIGLGPDRWRGPRGRWALRVDPRHVLVAERAARRGYGDGRLMCVKDIGPRECGPASRRARARRDRNRTGSALARRARAWLDEREG